MSGSGLNDPEASGISMPSVPDGGSPEDAGMAGGAPVSPILTGRVGRAMFWLAIPVLGEQALNMCVGFWDMFLARFVGPEATVAVGLAAHFSWLIAILFTLVATAATALVARAFGERKPADANLFAAQATGLGLGMGMAAAVVVSVAAPIVPSLFGLHSEAAAMATRFIRVETIGHCLGGVMYVGNACRRGAGDTRTPMWTMAFVNACNIAISSVLSLGLLGLSPRLGVTGIAAGTACARIIGGLVVLATLARPRRRTGDDREVRIRFRQMRPRGDIARRLLRIGVPAGLDGLTIWLGQLLFVRIINGLATGDLQTDTYAAHIIGIRIEALSYLSAYAWATAAATMVGQSLGARDPTRAERSGHLAARQSAAIAAVLSVVYFALAPQLYGLFAADPRVIEIGVPAFRWLALFQIPCALMIVYPGALRGAGDTRFPLAFAVVGMAAVRLPLAYLGGHILHWGLPGAWIGMFADMSVRATLGAWRFRQGGWKAVRV